MSEETIPIARGNSATMVVRRAIDIVKKHGRSLNRWGGTIPEKLGVGAEQNRPRDMLEVPYLVAELTDPTKNWTDIGNSTLITFREQEDHFTGANPGRVVLHSKMYREWQDEDGYLPLTYGERLIGYPSTTHDTINQLQCMARKLRLNPSTRKACATMWYPDYDQFSDLPSCNISFQASVVDDKLEWTTINRSLDLYNGLTENLFMFTSWQRELAFLVGVEPGTYRTISSNAHLYVDKMERIDTALQLADPYDLYMSQPIWPRHSVYEFTGLFQVIDKALDSGDHETVSRTMETIREEDPYWAAFKGAGVADWYIVKKEWERARKTAFEYTHGAPWAENIQRRIKE